MQLKFLTFLLLGGVLVAATDSARAEIRDFSIDPVHSEVGFQVRHLTGRVPGHFNEFAGTVRLDPENVAKTLDVTGTVQVASVDTGNEKRDNHLRTADFFDVEQHPEMTLVTRSVEGEGDDLRLVADLTIRGITKPVAFDVDYNGAMTNPFTGTPVTGLTLEGVVNRKDFDIVWNKALDAGGFLLGDDVRIEIHLEATHMPEQES